MYLYSIEVVVVVVRRRQKGALGSFSLTVYATATRLTAVLHVYHIGRTQGFDKVQLNHDWLRLKQTNFCWGEIARS